MQSRNLVLAISTMMVLGLLAIPASADANWTQFQGSTDKNAFTVEDGSTSDSTNWETYLGGGGWMGIDSVPIVVGDYVYAIASNGDLYKVSDTGTKVTSGSWPVSLAGNGFQNSVPATNGSAIFVITTGYGNTPTLYAIDADDGDTLWSTTVGTSDYQCSSPILYDDDKLYFGTVRMSNLDATNDSDDGTYYCYDEDGTQDWSTTTTDGEGYYWAGACSVGNYIVYGNDAGNVTLVEKADGDVADSFDISSVFSDNSEIRSTCVYYDNGTDERIYFTAKSGSCYYVGLDESGGVYSFDTSDKDSNTGLSYSTSTPAIDIGEGVVYVCASGGLYALDADDLSQNWKHGSDAAQSSPVISDDLDSGDNVVYYTTNVAAGTCYGVKDNGASYTEKFDYTPTNDNYILQGVAISGGQVFFGNDDGYLIGLG
ncbi:PQQ-binding-like beta-propeller repeat protein [Methanococcoides sp. NM1]|uniref:outer membrane protein assembly factor BamB family protein n=1 Tax=Methanococcoides sp. NM1 TaxID=1201013 RepID=UPI0010840DED|nr:PQQ-binding-like beta-propeller repeat protein [Methanococcoides sp. NM1]